MTRSMWWPTVVALALVLNGSDATGQRDPSASDSPLRKLAFLEGSWAGTIDGTIGPATGKREYRFIVGGRFLLMMHDRDPATRDASRDAYEEWSIFSFDTARGVIVVREFLAEGVVNQYACRIDAAPTRLACEGESVEGAAGLTLKLAYDVADPDHFAETFEIFGPDGRRRVRMEGQWQRTGGRGP